MVVFLQDEETWPESVVRSRRIGLSLLDAFIFVIPASGRPRNDGDIYRALFLVIIRSSVSSRSASPGGLSQRSRLMRGKRMAMPDLWRVERWRPSKATSSTR